MPADACTPVNECVCVCVCVCVRTRVCVWVCLSVCPNVCVAVTKNVPYACGNFHTCASYQISKTATARPGVDMGDSVLVDRHVTCPASRAQVSGLDQRCCKLRLKLLAKKT